jgi:two-component system NtrC family sensor kinase
MAFRFVDLPLRRKFILIFLAVICLGGMISLFLGTRIEHRTIISLAETKVRLDLGSARAIYEAAQDKILTALTVAAELEDLQNTDDPDQAKALGSILEKMVRRWRLEFLSYTEAGGRVIARADPAATVADIRIADPLFAQAIQGNPLGATRLLSKDAIRRESPGLAKRVGGDALALLAAVPVSDPSGKIRGVLSGGRLLNDDTEIVDRIKATVFEGERTEGRDFGVVTIFQGDRRVATNVLDVSGVRAIGTRADPEVRRVVLEQGRPWTGRARVLSDWFITAYEPLRDPDGAVIGMLSLGLLERPYLDLRNTVMAKFTGMAVLCAAGLLILLTILTTRLIRPLGDIVAAASRVAQGDLEPRVDVKTRDEVGELGLAFNRMTGELKKAKENLLQWTWTLESRVEERTRALRDIQESMARSEKMASLGQLAAGVAHEINNPLTSILLNAHLLLEQADPSDPSATALRLIAEETERCAQIVAGLLEFSRRTPPEKRSSDLNALIERTIGLLSGQAWARNIRITRNLDRALPPLPLDAAKVQQVFWNLILNACEAMPEGGTISVVSRRSADGQKAEVVFSDSGTGIPKEILSRIFDPFFTTKTAGTGLGLAVAQGVIEQHGGTITVRNETGRGAVFTLQWPLPDKG